MKGLLGVLALIVSTLADDKFLAKHDGGDIQDYSKDEIGDFPCYFFDGE